MRVLLYVLLLIALLLGCNSYDDDLTDDTSLIVDGFYADRVAHHAGESVRVHVKMRGNPPAGLSYTYSFVESSGSITPEGASALVTLSQAGRAVIKVVVSSSDGKTASKTVDLLGQNSAPELVSWSVDRTLLQKGQTANFSVEAFDKDADDLEYIFTLSTNYGTLATNGGSAIFTAPSDLGGQVTVHITVRDKRGGELSMSKELIIEKGWLRLTNIYSSPVNLGTGPHFSACGDRQGRFYIVYRGTVKRSVDGVNWQQLGTETYFSKYPIQCDSHNNPHVLHRVSGDRVVSVYSNNSWHTNSTLLTYSKTVYKEIFTVGLDDIPVVGWVYDDYTIAISYFSNGAWQSLPPLTNDSANRTLSCFRLGDGSVWAHHYLGATYLLKRWTGAAWQTVTLPDTGSFSLQQTGYTVWINQNGSFYRWNSGAWQYMFAGDGVVAEGADGAHHVFKNVGGTYWGFTIRNGVKESFRQGQLPNAMILGSPKGVYYYSIYAAGNPSRPYLIYRNWHGDAFAISAVY